MKEIKKELTEVELLKEAEIKAKCEVYKKETRRIYKRNIALFLVALILTVLFVIFKEQSWFPKLNMLFFALYLIYGVTSLISNIIFISYCKKLYIDNKKTRIKYLILSIIIILMAIIFFLRSNIFYK